MGHWLTAMKRKRVDVSVDALRPAEGAVAPFECYFPRGKPAGDVKYSLYEGSDKRAGYMVVASQVIMDTRLGAPSSSPPPSSRER